MISVTAFRGTIPVAVGMAWPRLRVERARRCPSVATIRTSFPWNAKSTPLSAYRVSSWDTAKLVWVSISRKILASRVTHDFGELSRRHRDRSLPADLRRHRDTRTDLKIRRGHAHALALRLEQDVGEDWKRLAWLHDVLHHLEAFEERVTVNHYFHKVLQFV